MWKLLLLISISGLAAGFALGYSVRANLSYRRRRQAERSRMIVSVTDELPRSIREALAELSRRSRRHVRRHRRG